MSSILEEVSIQPLELADSAQTADVYNRVFARTAAIHWVYGYPPSDDPAYENALAHSLRRRKSMLLRRLCKPTEYLFTAKLGTHVVGMCMWRCPLLEPRQFRVVPLYLRVIGLCLSWYDWLVEHIWPERLQVLLDPWLAGFLQRRKKLISLDDDPPEAVQAAGFWELNALCVLPAYERRGIGTKLLQIGLDLADSTHRAVTMSATSDGEQLYSRHGFAIQSRGLVLDEDDEGPIYHTIMLRPPS